MYVVVGFKRVLMPPKQELLQHEECEYSRENVQGRLSLWPAVLERIGQQVNESVSEHGPGRETDHNEDGPFQSLAAYQNGRYAYQRNEADHNHTGNRIEPRQRGAFHIFQTIRCAATRPES